LTLAVPRVALVTMRGVIASDDEMRTGLSEAMLAPEMLKPDGTVASYKMGGGELINLQRFERTLTRAFATPGCRAVALLIDSPGGSPAQSSLIYQRLRALRARHPRVALLAFVEDAAVSGGYYIACAADEIIADHNSVVGSVGVISRGFGYVSMLKKKGLERRVHAAGDSKSGLDPYLPMRSKDLAQQRRLLKELHSNFITAVGDGRGDRLRREKAARLYYNNTRSYWSFSKPSKSTLSRLVARGAGLFDGSVYSGGAGHALGLVDRIGEMRSELQRRYGKAVHVLRVEPEVPLDYSRLLRWLL